MRKNLAVFASVLMVFLSFLAFSGTAYAQSPLPSPHNGAGWCVADIRSFPSVVNTFYHMPNAGADLSTAIETFPITSFNGLTGVTMRDGYYFSFDNLPQKFFDAYGVYNIGVWFYGGVTVNTDRHPTYKVWPSGSTSFNRSPSPAIPIQSDAWSFIYNHQHNGTDDRLVFEQLMSFNLPVAIKSVAIEYPCSAVPTPTPIPTPTPTSTSGLGCDDWVTSYSNISAGFDFAVPAGYDTYELSYDGADGGSLSGYINFNFPHGGADGYGSGGLVDNSGGIVSFGGGSVQSLTLGVCLSGVLGTPIPPTPVPTFTPSPVPTSAPNPTSTPIFNGGGDGGGVVPIFDGTPDEAAQNFFSTILAFLDALGLASFLRTIIYTMVTISFIFFIIKIIT